MIAQGSLVSIFVSILTLTHFVTWVLGDFFRGPPRFDGDRPRYGDRDGYRGGQRGGDVGGEKGGAPADYQPSFQVNLSLSLSNHP